MLDVIRKAPCRRSGTRWCILQSSCAESPVNGIAGSLSAR